MIFVAPTTNPHWDVAPRASKRIHRTHDSSGLRGASTWLIARIGSSRKTNYHLFMPASEQICTYMHSLACMHAYSFPGGRLGYPTRSEGGRIVGYNNRHSRLWFEQLPSLAGPRAGGGPSPRLVGIKLFRNFLYSIKLKLQRFGSGD